MVGTAYERAFRKLKDLVPQMEKESATPQDVARLLVRAFEARKPKARYTHWRALMDSPWTTLIPDMWWDAILGRMLDLEPPSASGA
jgi:hypothetical protein